jgi:hypothetical protein
MSHTLFRASWTDFPHLPGIQHIRMLEHFLGCHVPGSVEEQPLVSKLVLQV